MSEEAEASSVPSLRSQRHFTAWTPLRYVQALRYAPAAQPQQQHFATLSHGIQQSGRYGTLVRQ